MATRELTLRGLVLGVLITTVFTAANVYLGLKVGHATRSIAECLEDARADATVQTALLEARFLSGEQPIFAEFAEGFATARREWGIGQFFAALARRAGGGGPRQGLIARLLALLGWRR